jgi:hypothetical protein
MKTLNLAELAKTRGGGAWILVLDVGWRWFPHARPGRRFTKTVYRRH